MEVVKGNGSVRFPVQELLNLRERINGTVGTKWVVPAFRGGDIQRLLNAWFDLAKSGEFT
jgi:hypothetical protein